MKSFRTEPRETPANGAVQGAYRSRTGVSVRTDGKPQNPCIAAGSADGADSDSRLLVGDELGWRLAGFADGEGRRDGVMAPPGTFPTNTREPSRRDRTPQMAADDPRHGTENGYNNRFCRCPACTEAHRLHHVARRRRLGIVPLAEWNAAHERHGTARYKKGCRCEVCRAASAAAKRRHRARHPEHRARDNAARMKRYYRNKSQGTPDAVSSEVASPTEGSEA